MIDYSEHTKLIRKYEVAPMDFDEFMVGGTDGSYKIVRVEEIIDKQTGYCYDIMVYTAEGMAFELDKSALPYIKEAIEKGLIVRIDYNVSITNHSYDKEIGFWS